MHLIIQDLEVKNDVV